MNIFILQELKLKFDGRTGFLITVFCKNEEWQLKQNFFQYTAGNSGAYLFYANSEAQPITNKLESISVAKGKVRLN